MLDTTPIRFQDVLKLAKIVALQQGALRITTDILGTTLTRYFDTSALTEADATRLGIAADARKVPALSDGRLRLADVPATPTVALVAEIRELRQHYGEHAISGLYLPAPADRPDAAEPSNEIPQPAQEAPASAVALGGNKPEAAHAHDKPETGASLQDCLKLAKVIALEQGATSIDLPLLQQALARYVDTTGLSDAQAGLLGITVAPAQRNDGWLALENCPRTPKVALSDEVLALRDRLLNTPLALHIPGAATPAANPPISKQDVRPEPDAQQQAAAAATKALDNDAPSSLAHNSARVSQALTQIDALLRTIGQTVIGQPAALTRLRTALLARSLHLDTPGKPRLLICVGPAGTGKSLLARQLVAHGDSPGLVLNMASYQSHNEGFGLTGLREGYSNAGPGRLTSFVRRHPRAIVVFDDIDRAHPNVQSIVGNLLSDGYLEDEYGFGSEKDRALPENRRVSFHAAQLIFTLRPSPALTEDGSLSALIHRDPAQAATLLAEDLLNRSPADERQQAEHSAGVLTPYLANYLSQAPVLPFAELEIEALVGITRKTLEAFGVVFSKQAFPVVFEDFETIARLITLSFGPDITPLELAESSTQWLTEACFQDTTANSELPSRVRIQVAPAVLAWFAERELGSLHRNQFRRREVLRYRLDTRREGNELLLCFEQVRLETIKGRRDYGRDDGFAVEIPQLHFSDIKGHLRAKERLQQIAHLLTSAQHAAEHLPPPKGVLLYGRPGTGKTMLAKALAAEAGLPFIAVAGPQLFNPDLTRAIFARARRFAPSIVFIDEIDALGVRGVRGMEPAINQLLAEIDGFASHGAPPVFIIAATNFLSNVDPALLRSGRLDLHLEIPLLDRDARRHFIESRLCLLPRPLAPAEGAWNIEALLALTAGMSGADFEKVYRELMLSLQQNKAAQVSYEQLLEQINTIKYGERRRHPPLSNYLAAVAYHEAGHAVLSARLNPDRPLEQVTIAGRGDAHGFVAFSNDGEPARPMNRQESLDRICVKLAGRIAQLRQFPASHPSGGSDNGAASDLSRATDLAWLAVTEWGLDESFGWVSLSSFPAPLPPAWLQRAQQRVDAWMTEARARTEQLVTDNWSAIAAIAEHLLKEDTMDGPAVLAYLQAADSATRA